MESLGIHFHARSFIWLSNQFNLLNLIPVFLPRVWDSSADWAQPSSCTFVSPQGVPTFHAAMSGAESVKFSTKRCLEGEGKGVAKDRPEICTVIGCYSERGPACVGNTAVVWDRVRVSVSLRAGFVSWFSYVSRSALTRWAAMSPVADRQHRLFICARIIPIGSG